LHPTQALADFMTIVEKKQKLAGLNCVFVGDGNNMAHSLLLGGAKVGLNVTVACPVGYEPNPQVMAMALESARATGAIIKVEHDPQVAVQNADILYTDVWASMGEEAQAEEKEKAFKNYQINQKLLELAQKDAMVLHCLPAKRGKEITDEVIEGPQSFVFDEAENRLHAHKAILAAVM
jgi:ornithine carbamoyltransferase